MFSRIVFAQYQKLFKIEKLLELFVKSDAQNQRKLGCRAELTCLYRADGIARYAHHLGKLSL